MQVRNCAWQLLFTGKSLKLGNSNRENSQFVNSAFAKKFFWYCIFVITCKTALPLTALRIVTLGEALRSAFLSKITATSKIVTVLAIMLLSIYWVSIESMLETSYFWRANVIFLKVKRHIFSKRHILGNSKNMTFRKQVFSTFFRKNVNLYVRPNFPSIISSCYSKAQSGTTIGSEVLTSGIVF